MNETVTEVTTEGDTTTEEENQTAENTTEGN